MAKSDILVIEILQAFIGYILVVAQMERKYARPVVKINILEENLPHGKALHFNKVINSSIP